MSYRSHRPCLHPPHTHTHRALLTEKIRWYYSVIYYVTENSNKNPSSLLHRPKIKKRFRLNIEELKEEDALREPCVCVCAVHAHWLTVVKVICKWMLRYVRVSLRRPWTVYRLWPRLFQRTWARTHTHAQWPSVWWLTWRRITMHVNKLH